MSVLTTQVIRGLARLRLAPLRLRPGRSLATESTTPPPTTPRLNLADQINARLADCQSQNVLVYSCKSSGSLRINLLGVGGSVLLLFAAYNSWYLFAAFEGRRRNQSLEGNFMNFVLDMIQSAAFKYTLCGTIVCVALAILGSTVLFTQRVVNKLYLLKGGKTLGVVTDGVFGRKQSYRLGLAETSFMSSRRQRSPMVSFKNRQHFFYFMLNNLDAEYHEPVLFDHYICTKRF